VQKTVFVALSGGVDSSVAAYLLQQEGYHLVGVTLKIPGYNPEDAFRVSEKLGIPHYLWDPAELFEKKVISYFCKEYLSGRTPNPCVVCNYYIKFGFMLKKALSSGASYLATGHYARVEYCQERGRWLLKKGIDDKRDQSYFLFMLRQEQMPHILFPLGSKTKSEVRQIAREAGLPVAERSESREICFIPDNDYRGFLIAREPDAVKPGPIYDLEGNIVGEHKGLAFYTIGQRRGLGLSLGYPAYVVDLDYKRNALIVGRSDQVFAEGLIAEEVNFIALEKLTESIEADVKIRYTTPSVPASIHPLEGDSQVEVRFLSPQKAVTPGQAVVFYDGDLVLGGGFIAKRLK